MKVLNYILLLLFALGWFLGCSSDTARWLYKNELVKDDYRYGDLYRFANLADFRVPVEKCNAPTQQPMLPVHLVLFGDSFTEEGRIEKAHFVANRFERHFVANDAYISIDTSAKNVLVIETVERHFRERFGSVYQHAKINEPQPQNSISFFQQLINWKVPYSTERHESVLFSSDFIFTIKEWKAAFNKAVFHRVDNNVVLSKDNSEILYSLAINPGPNSIFDPVSENEIADLVNNINETYRLYKSKGFDEVYLSIIPNKESILGADLGEYNHLIERVQQHPALQIPCIDMYAPLKNGGEKLFDKGDTHWNCTGKAIWVNALNNEIRSVAN